MLEQFITSYDYAKLIKMQSIQPAPFVGCLDIKKLPNSKKGVKAKTKTFGRRK